MAGEHLVDAPAPTAWRPGPRGHRGRGRRRARRGAAARGRSSAPGRSARACARPRTGCRRCGRAAGRRRPRASRSVGAVVVELVVVLAPAARARRTTRRPPRRAPISSRGIRSAMAALVQPDARDAARRRRPCRAPRRGSRRPRTVGWICAEATCSSVVLPAPLGPRTTQRSSSSTVQSTPSSRVAWPRRTVTSASSRTASMCWWSPSAARSGSAAGRAPNLYGRVPSRRDLRTPRLPASRCGSPVAGSGHLAGRRLRPAWTTPADAIVGDDAAHDVVGVPGVATSVRR